MTEKKITQRQAAPRKHGAYAIRDRGPDAIIDPERVARLADLRQLARSHEGRQDLKEELLSRVLLICEIGFAELNKSVDEGKSIWETPVTARLGTFLAEARRIIDSFPKGDEGIVDAVAVLRDIKEVLDEQQTENKRTRNPLAGGGPGSVG